MPKRDPAEAVNERLDHLRKGFVDELRMAARRFAVYVPTIQLRDELLRLEALADELVRAAARAAVHLPYQADTVQKTPPDADSIRDRPHFDPDATPITTAQERAQRTTQRRRR